MNPWFAKAVILIAAVAMVAIRSPHGHRSWQVKVVQSRKGRLEIFLMIFASLGFFTPIVWIATPWLAFADFRLYPLFFVAGTLILALSLWLFYLTHADLGTNWSVTLEIRGTHKLVTDGVYRRVRHPMYSAFLLYAIGQAVVVPNWIAGPSYLVTMALLVALRLKPEEQLMRDQFKEEYDAYVARTKRLIPGVW